MATVLTSNSTYVLLPPPLVCIANLPRRRAEGPLGLPPAAQYVEKKSESDSFFGDYDSAIKPINRGKNRYSNVLPRA